MKYHLTYPPVQSHPDGIEKHEVPEGSGACTAIILGSLLYPPDGSYSAVFVSKDGRTGEPLSDAEMWKAWAMLAYQLSQSETLGPGKRGLCAQVHEVVRSAVLSVR